MSDKTFNELVSELDIAMSSLRKRYPGIHQRGYMLKSLTRLEVMREFTRSINDIAKAMGDNLLPIFEALSDSFGVVIKSSEWSTVDLYPGWLDFWPVNSVLYPIFIWVVERLPIRILQRLI